MATPTNKSFWDFGGLQKWERLAQDLLAVLTRIAVALERPSGDSRILATELKQLKINNRKIKEAQVKYGTQKKEESQKK